ncbi:DNA-binding protein [Hymenobacter radiodurans]|uniref:DNA-binding protein n=1 Tax=Hymenobacter radiodurans TaxID=2496028 RepID=UPI0010584F8D|nr:DNA-binding protein [Hymenobacter radiodurans]
MQVSFDFPPAFIPNLAAAIAQHLNAPVATPERKDAMLTVTEAAKLLCGSPKYVRQLISLGKVKYIDANRGTGLRPSYTLMESDVRAYLKDLRR